MSTSLQSYFDEMKAQEEALSTESAQVEVDIDVGELLSYCIESKFNELNEIGKFIQDIDVSLEALKVEDGQVTETQIASFESKITTLLEYTGGVGLEKLFIPSFESGDVAVYANEAEEKAEAAKKGLGAKAKAAWDWVLKKIKALISWVRGLGKTKEEGFKQAADDLKDIKEKAQVDESSNESVEGDVSTEAATWDIKIPAQYGKDGNNVIPIGTIKKLQDRLKKAFSSDKSKLVSGSVNNSNDFEVTSLLKSEEWKNVQDLSIDTSPLSSTVDANKLMSLAGRMEKDLNEAKVLHAEYKKILDELESIIQKLSSVSNEVDSVEEMKSNQLKSAAVRCYIVALNKCQVEQTKISNSITKAVSGLKAVLVA